MLLYTLLFIGFFLIALIIRIYRTVFYDLAQKSVGLVNELLSDYDEDLKISQMQKSTNKLTIAFLKMLMLLVIAVITGSIPLVAYYFITKTNFISTDLTSIYSIIAVSAGATVPFLIPLGKKKDTGYSELSQLLHHIALDNYRISEKLFKQETKKIKRKNLERKKDFVIISGLARAGTTSLMNDLASINGFVSLSYANMPFLLSPNLWGKLYKPKTKEVKERSHKDGIMIGLNSNEALEEYFFKVKANDSFINDTHLREYKLQEEDYIDYLDYQSIIKLDNNKIYLAKNNNFILRYKSMREYNDDFLMVILYRDPLTHAASLKEKHHYYSKLQQQDPFVLNYMNWLGHHEFGLNQKPFLFEDSEVVIASDKNTTDFWLKSWINYYNYVLTIQHPNTLLVSYDAYCNNPQNVITSIVDKTGIQTNVPFYKPFENKREYEADVSGDLLHEAQEIYRELTLRKM